MSTGGALIALAEVEQGALAPKRIFICRARCVLNQRLNRADNPLVRAANVVYCADFATLLDDIPAWPLSPNTKEKPMSLSATQTGAR